VPQSQGDTPVIVVIAVSLPRRVNQTAIRPFPGFKKMPVVIILVPALKRAGQPANRIFGLGGAGQIGINLRLVVVDLVIKLCVRCNIPRAGVL
jgi:hypothetical protein